MKVKKFESQEAYERYYENREHKYNDFDYVYENGIHNIDGEVKAKSAMEAKAKLIKAMEEIGLTCTYNDEITNDLSREGKDIMKIEIEELDNNIYYVNYKVSELWA